MEHTSCLKFENYHIFEQNIVKVLQYLQKKKTHLVSYMLPKPMTLVAILTKKLQYLENKVEV